jgi:hypothetical protein
MGTGIFPGGLNGRSVKLTTHLHLAPKLRMSGAERLIPLYTLMTRAGTTLPLPNLRDITAVLGQYME